MTYKQTWGEIARHLRHIVGVWLAAVPVRQVREHGERLQSL